MKVCFPIKENNGIDSIVFNHFGSAPFFIIVDLENNNIEVVNNGDLGHEHGMCQPIKALSGHLVDAVLVAGIGAGAIMKLNGMGIKVYKVAESTISENIELLKNNKLVEFSANNACTHHDCKH